MNDSKKRSAEILFDAIGNIDDRFIYEAQNPFSVCAKRKKRSIKLAVAAISFAVITLIALTSITVFQIADSFFSDGGANIPEADTTTLEGALIEATDNPRIQAVDGESIDFFDREAKLIWRFDGNDEYYVIPISSQSTLSQIKTQLKAEKNELSPTSAEEITCDVWISYGDGTVISPYLHSNAGNVGMAELFEYSPEVEPSSELTEIVNELISAQ